jgi:hypothetical protein
MPAIDYCQPQIIRALEKEGWRVESSPLKVVTPTRYVYFDAELTRKINGSQEHIMLAEVKCFPNQDDTTTDLYIAIGQYLLYRAILAEARQNIPLYLAIPKVAYKTIFDVVAKRVIEESKIKVLVVNLDAEEIDQWIEW